LPLDALAHRTPQERQKDQHGAEEQDVRQVEDAGLGDAREERVRHKATARVVRVCRLDARDRGLDRRDQKSSQPQPATAQDPDRMQGLPETRRIEQKPKPEEEVERGDGGAQANQARNGPDGSVLHRVVIFDENGDERQREERCASGRPV
jgi:hypothetical protein